MGFIKSTLGKPQRTMYRGLLTSDQQQTVHKGIGIGSHKLESVLQTQPVVSVFKTDGVYPHLPSTTLVQYRYWTTTIIYRKILINNLFLILFTKLNIKQHK